MALNVVLILLGIALAWLTLRDVFDTVVVPAGNRGILQVTRRVGGSLLILWKTARGRRHGISFSFAPLVLVSSFVVWMSLLSLAFGLMLYGVRNHFAPPVRSFGDSIYIAGSALATVGMSPHFPTGPARWFLVAAGFCGLAVMTMAVTYLLEVQSSVSRRDAGIIKLNTSAGHPPIALTLLERFAELRCQSALPAVLEENRDWCATVRQSHSAHPSLIYFQSISTGAGWPAALGVILDLALISEHLIDQDVLHGGGVLLREEGERMAKELARISGVKPVESRTSREQFEHVAQCLRSSGYPVRADPDFGQMIELRNGYMGCVDALAQHLGKPSVRLTR